MVQAYCKEIGLKSFIVAGYAKDPQSPQLLNVEQTNHSWNVVYLDSAWRTLDLFWTITAAQPQENGTVLFFSRFKQAYFCMHPDEVLINRIPADPVFQLKAYPVTINDFLMPDSTFDTSEYIAFADSLTAYLKLSSRLLSLRIADNAFAFNKANPNMLIINYYNAGVDILNNKAATTKS